MSFEDVECLKNVFTVYDIPKKTVTPSNSKTFLVIRKRNTTYTRVTVAPPLYGIKHNLKMLLFSLLSKLRIKRGTNRW
jgi:hypothetical protein